MSAGHSRAKPTRKRMLMVALNGYAANLINRESVSFLAASKAIMNVLGRPGRKNADRYSEAIDALFAAAGRKDGIELIPGYRPPGTFLDGEGK
jgi:hypothetical protein